MKDSKIEWTHHTANLWWGCSKVHAGCDNCYAESLSRRYGNDIWGKNKPRKATKSVWGDFFKWQAEAQHAGEMYRVFVGSMMDIFEKPMTAIDSKGELMFVNTGDLRDKFFNEIVPNCPNLIFLLLTKRPSNINKYIPESWKENAPENVMFGTSVSEPANLNLITQLFEVKGARFVSVEPQIAEIDLSTPITNRAWMSYLDMVHWVIQGGESGHGKRPFNLDWARKMRDDCAFADIPYFFKQIDKMQPIPEDLQVRQFPDYHNIVINFH